MPVPPIVVVQRHHRGQLEQRRLAVAQELVADLRVGADDRELVLVEGAGLEQHPVGDLDLAEVVQRGSEPDQLGTVVVDAQLQRDRPRGVADPADVLAGVVVAELRGQRKPVHGFGLGPPELGGAVPDAGLQRAVVVLQSRVQPARLQEVVHPQQDLGAVERLGDEVHRPTGEGPVAGGRVGVGGQDEDRQVRPVFVEVLQQVDHLEPVHGRHVEVQQHQVGPAELQHLRQRHRVGGRVHVPVALVPEDPPQEQHVRRFVVDDEDPGVVMGLGRVHAGPRISPTGCGRRCGRRRHPAASRCRRVWTGSRRLRRPAGPRRGRGLRRR